MFRNRTESGIWNPAGIPGGRTLKGANCNKHTAGRLKNHNKNRCQQWHSAATVPLHKPLIHAAVLPCCRHYCHCLSRGSSNGAGMAVCGGGSSTAALAVAQSSCRPMLLCHPLPLLCCLSLCCPLPSLRRPSPWLCAVVLPPLAIIVLPVSLLLKHIPIINVTLRSLFIRFRVVLLSTCDDIERWFNCQQEKSNA